MVIAFYGLFFRIVRPIARVFYPMNEVPKRDESMEPCVFVCRHRNLEGPLNTLINMNTPVRPWILSVFCERHACYKQYRDYTFTKRLGWDKIRAVSAARVASLVVPALMRSIRGIPVYRDSARITKTLRMSIAALKAGESLIIYPDVDYTNRTDEGVSFYDGYLVMGMLYRRAMRKPLRFVPVHVDQARRRILYGEAVTLNPDAPDAAEERARVNRVILQRMAELA